MTLSSAEVSHAIAPIVRMIVEAAKRTLSETPPELAADLIDSGVTLSGGGALLPGLDRVLALETGLSVRVDECPLDCVVLGAERMIGSPDAFEAMDAM